MACHSSAALSVPDADLNQEASAQTPEKASRQSQCAKPAARHSRNPESPAGDVVSEAMRRHRQHQRAADKMRFLAKSGLDLPSWHPAFADREEAGFGNHLVESLVRELEELRGTVSDMRGRCQELQAQVDELSFENSEAAKVPNRRWSSESTTLKTCQEHSPSFRPPKPPRSSVRTISQNQNRFGAERYQVSRSPSNAKRQKSFFNEDGCAADSRRDQPLTSWPRCSFRQEADVSTMSRSTPSLPGALPRGDNSPRKASGALPRGLDSPRVRWSLHKERFIAASPQRERDRCSTCNVTFSDDSPPTKSSSLEPSKLRRSTTAPLPVLLGRRGKRAATDGCALQAKASASPPDLAWSSLHCPPDATPEYTDDETDSTLQTPCESQDFTARGGGVGEPAAGCSTGMDEATVVVEINSPNSVTSSLNSDSVRRQLAPQVESAANESRSSTDAVNCVVAVCADAAAGPDTMLERTHAERSSGLEQVPTKRRSSLDSGFSQMTSIALSPSDVTSRTLSTLWQSRSINVFELQKEVVNAHAESPCQELPDAGSVYVGIPGSKLFTAHLGWCQKGSPFRRLGVALKVLGVVCAYPSYTTGPGEHPKAARFRHIVALLYIASWQLGIWIVLVSHASQAMDEGPHDTSRYGATVRGVMLLASSASHFSSCQFFAGGAFADLSHYAARSVFIQSWATVSQRFAAALLAPFLVLASGSLLAEGPGIQSAAEALTWAPIMVQYLIFLTTLQFCSLGLDAFALELLNTNVLEGLVGRFDKLHAAMRRSAYAVQVGLTVFVTAIFGVFFATVYHLMFAGFDAPSGHAAEAAILPWRRAGDAAAAMLVVVLFLLGMHLLNQIATVNAKCKRLPVLIQSLNFGVEIDHDKWCVAAHIASLEAGFFVYNVPVTRWSVLKFGYFSLAATSFLLTRLVFAVR